MKKILIVGTVLLISSTFVGGYYLYQYANDREVEETIETSNSKLNLENDKLEENLIVEIEAKENTKEETNKEIVEEKNSTSKSSEKSKSTEKSSKKEQNSSTNTKNQNNQSKNDEVKVEKTNTEKKEESDKTNNTKNQNTETDKTNNTEKKDETNKTDEKYLKFLKEHPFKSETECELKGDELGFADPNIEYTLCVKEGYEDIWGYSLTIVYVNGTEKKYTTN